MTQRMTSREVSRFSPLHQSRTSWGHRLPVFLGCPEICPRARIAVNERFRMSMDAEFCSKTLFLLYFISPKKRAWTSLELAGKEGMWDGWDSNPGPKP